MTERLSHTQLVTLAAYLLGGKDRFIDTEDIAVKCHQLAPGRFSWRKYPKQINLEGVRVRLLEETKVPAGSAMLRGSQARGWRLTPAGLAWASVAATDDANLLPGESVSRERGGSVDIQRLNRERARVKGSKAWSKWPKQASSISKQDAAEVFRLDSYATADLQALKVDRLRIMFIDDSELQEFLDHLEKCLTD